MNCCSPARSLKIPEIPNKFSKQGVYANKIDTNILIPSWKDSDFCK